MKLSQRTEGISPAALVALASGNMKNFLAATTEGGIEAQEKAGQLEQAGRSTLPIVLGFHGAPEEHRKPWEALGFKFTGKIVDEIFQEVAFPAGWKKIPTSHDMWTQIVDGKGRERGMIFYKAAFYDRKAHAHLATRFKVNRTYNNETVPTESVFLEDACGMVERRVDGLEKPDYKKDREAAWRAGDKIEAEMKTMREWLAETYPDYESPAAYWID